MLRHLHGLTMGKFCDLGHLHPKGLFFKTIEPIVQDEECDYVKKMNWSWNCVKTGSQMLLLEK
jgi:hypothetical protein